MSTELIPVSSPEVPQLRGRLTVKIDVYYNTHGEQTTGESTRFAKLLDTEEQAYSRTVKITEAWQPIDLGWLKDKKLSYLLCENSTKVETNTGKSTSELRDELSTRVIDIGLANGYGDEDKSSPLLLYSLSPEEGCTLPNHNVEDIRVRCAKGVAKFTYFAVPG